MKKIVSLFVLFAAIVLTGCSSNGGYNFDEANDLVKKIESNEEFTQDDYSKAISLMKSATEYAFDLIADVDFSDKEAAAMKMTEIADAKESKEIDATNTKITTYVYMHRSDLDEANTKALEDVEKYATERAKELQEKMLGAN